MDLTQLLAQPAEDGHQAHLLQLRGVQLVQMGLVAALSGLCKELGQVHYLTTSHNKQKQ